MEQDNDITRLIQEWQQGNRAAEQALFEAMYRALHRIAMHCLRSEPNAGSLSPTVLVHEAYLRFANAEKLPVVDRSHLLALAARVMRRIIVDRARARKSEKRGGDQVKIELVDNFISSTEDADEIIAINDAPAWWPTWAREDPSAQPQKGYAHRTAPAAVSAPSRPRRPDLAA